MLLVLATENHVKRFSRYLLSSELTVLLAQLRMLNKEWKKFSSRLKNILGTGSWRGQIKIRRTKRAQRTFSQARLAEEC